MKKLLFSFLLIFLAVLSAIGQSTPHKQQNQLNEYIQLRPAEKVYLHLDKDLYSPGESIWFSAYMANGSTHIPGSLSTVLYVSLFDQHQNLITYRNIRTEEGLGKGDFKLPDTLAAGDYIVQAHTLYMQNFDPSFFFTKRIRILTGDNNETQEPPLEQTQATLQADSAEADPMPKLSLTFFPEGGEMINGLESRIAVKAEDAFGNGLEVNGKVINSRGDTISWFKTHKFGLGDFMLLPNPDDVYYAAVVNFGGLDFTYMLPKRKESGFAMRIQNHNNKLYIKATHTSPGEIAGSYILGHTRGITFSVIEGETGTDEIYTALSTENIPSGIAHFTLFDKNGIPQSERLVFIDNPEDRIAVTIKFNEEAYSTRSKASFGLELHDHSGAAVNGRVSATVIDKSLLNIFKDSDHIKSSFLLTSDLKGEIPEPAYFFNEANKDRHYLLDLLMLTHGWRRFTWKEINETSLASPEFMPENGFTIKGHLRNYYDHSKEADGTVKLMVLEDPLFSLTDTTSEKGEFSFTGLHFTDTATFVLQANKIRKKKRNDKNGNDAIFINIDTSTANFTPPAAFLSAEKDLYNKKDSLLAEYIQKTERIKKADSAYRPDMGTIVLDEVTVAKKKDPRKDPFYHPRKMYDSPTQRLIPDSIFQGAFMGAQVIFDVIQGRIPGTRVILDPDNEKMVIGKGGGVMIFLLDGNPVSHQVINTIPPTEVAFIDILKGPKAFAYGAGGDNGVIAVYTKTGTGQKPKNDLQNNPGIIHFKHPGYYLAREFYSPNYQTKSPQHLKPDFRSTLYWNPEIFVGEKGSAEVDFFTSDEEGNYMLLIEGITAEGIPFTGENEFKVKR